MSTAPVKPSTQTLEQKLTQDEEHTIAKNIGTRRDILVRVIGPFVLVSALYVALGRVDWYLYGRLSHSDSLTHFDLALIGYSLGFILAWLIILATGKRYDSGIVAPLWYVLQEWIILAGVPVYLLLMLPTNGPSRLGAFIGLCIVVIVHIGRSWWKTGRKIPNLVMETMAIMDDAAHFTGSFAIRPVHRAILSLRATLRAFLILPGWVLEKTEQFLSNRRSVADFSVAGAAQKSWTEWLAQQVRSDTALQIIHISDLHLRPENQGDLEHGRLQNPVIKQSLIEAIKAASPALVVASGDITDTGSAADYRIATDFFGELKSALGGIPIVVAPGNHDVSINPSTWTLSGNWQSRQMKNAPPSARSRISERISGRLRRARQRLPRLLVSALGAANRPFFRPFDIRMRRFNNLSAAIGMCATSSLRGVNLFQIEGHDVSVITLCTAIPSSWIGFNGLGEFSRASMHELEALSPQLRTHVVVLCHHHAQSPEGDAPFYKDLDPFQYAHLCASGAVRFADTLIRTLGRNESNCIVLHGHTHIPRHYYIQAPGDRQTRIPVRCAPSAFEGSHPGFMLHRWGQTVETIRSTWDYNRNQFVVDTSPPCI